MAQQKGIIKLKGTIGDITFYKTKDGYLAKAKTSLDGTRIATDPNFARTRENGREFGEAATDGKLLRTSIRSFMKGAHDNRVTSRLTKLLTKIVKLDTTSLRGFRTIGIAIAFPNAMTMLKGEIEGRKNESSLILRTKFGRFVGLYALPWQKGAITPSQMNIKQQSISIKSFEEERQQLLNYLSQVINKKTFQEHPIFGKLNKKDWGRLIWKHLDHHLRQFSS